MKCPTCKTEMVVSSEDAYWCQSCGTVCAGEGPNGVPTLFTELLLALDSIVNSENKGFEYRSWEGLIGSVKVEDEAIADTVSVDFDREEWSALKALLAKCRPPS